MSAAVGIQFVPIYGNGQAIPFVRRNAPGPATTMLANPRDMQRLRRYEEHWRFYQGVQWNFEREEGDPLVTANYCRLIVNKKASWLVGKGMQICVPQALHHFTKPKLEEVWKYNDRKIRLMQMAITGGVTGDVFVLVTYQAPTDVEKSINPYTNGKIRIRVIQPHQVFPHWNPLNTEELLYVRIVTEVQEETPWNGFAGNDNVNQVIPLPDATASVGLARKRRYVETIYADRIEEHWEGQPPVARPNSLGEIPLVHISNEVFPGEYYGQSDLDGIIDVQRELNEKMTDLSDIINYHSSPITIITGAKARSLEKGPRNLWSITDPNARVTNLEMAGGGETSHKYIQLLLQMLMDLSGLPEGSLGRIQAISNTSSAALQVQFQPLVEATERKAPNYEAGLAKINYFILRWDQLANNDPLPTDLCAECGGRILQFKETGPDGRVTIRRKCYMINPQTLEFMAPGDVKINVKREHSFGTETRMITFDQAKKEWGKKSASYWDLEDQIDKEDQAQVQFDHAQKQKKKALADAQKQQAQIVDAQQPPASGPKVGV